jgi:methyl-accepting chemotaxis protein
VTGPESLEDLATELEDVAARLRSGELGADEAAELVQRSAQLAGRIGAELDARGRSADRLEGQERLL